MRLLLHILTLLCAVTTSASAAAMTKPDAMAIAKKLCDSQIPTGSTIQWTAYQQGETWQVIAIIGKPPKAHAVGIVLPVDGGAPQPCIPLAVRATPEP